MNGTPNRRRRIPPGRRARPAARWTPWEIVLLLISVVMIASPLLAAGWAIVSPTVAPAATLQQREEPPPEECPDGPCPPPTITVPPETPTATPAPTEPPTEPPPVTTTATTPPPCGQTGYDPCPPPPCDPTGYGTTDPCETPTAVPTMTTAPTSPPAPTAPPSTPAPTAPPATQQPSSGLRVTKEAIGLNGQGIALVGPGQEYLYLIRVDHSVTPAVPVTLQDDFAAGIEAVALVRVENGACQLTSRALSCTLTPSQSAIASALVRVRVTGASGTQIPNTAHASVPSTGESASGSAGTVLIGQSEPIVVPTSGPVTAPTSAPPPPAPTSAPVVVPTSAPPAPSNPRPNPPREPEPEPPAPAPTSEPVPPAPAPTSEPAAPAPTSAPPAPTSAPPAPTATPQPTAAPQARKQAIATPAPTRTPAPLQPTQTPAPTPTPAPTLPPVTTPEPEKPSLRFNLASDWGQVFVGDTLEFVVTLQNAGSDVGGSSPMMPQSRPVKLEALLDAPPIHDVVITDELDPHFEIIEATANGLAVTTDGQKVEATRGTLAGGETVTLTIKVRARDVEPSGLTVTNQARLTYRDESQPIFSNIVDVTIMPKALPTATPAPTAMPTPTTEPILQAAGAAPVIAPPEELGESLPQTSGGAPIAGVVLLGLTLLLRSVRVHRARVRI